LYFFYFIFFPSFVFHKTSQAHTPLVPNPKNPNKCPSTLATSTLLIGLFVEILEIFQKLIIFSHPKKKKKKKVVKENKDSHTTRESFKGGIFIWGTMESSN
jgi:hypothetical protein